MKMRVLFLGLKEWPANQGTTRAGGTGTYCDVLIEGLGQNVECVLVTQESMTKYPFESSGNLEIHRVRTIQNRIYKIMVGNLLCAVKAYFILKKQPVHIINAHTAWASLYAHFLAKVMAVPLVVTPQGDPYGYLGYTAKQFVPYVFVRILGMISTLVFPRAAAVVVSSPEEETRLREHTGANFKNICIIETGMRLPNIALCKNFDKRKLQILNVGRLTASKAVNLLLMGLSLLDKKLLDRIHVNIVGSGEDEEKLRQLCSSHELNEYVTFHGFIEHAAIGTFYQDADIFLFPSFMEGFSLALLEAMSYGLACVVNDYGLPFDQNEILLMGNNNPETIANALEKLIATPELIPEYGRRARETIETKYSQTIFARKYIDLYKEKIKHADADSVHLIEEVVSQTV